MNHGPSDIDRLIREEMRVTAAESQAEVWADGLSAGIEPEIIAEAALATALAELLRSAGEPVALSLLDRMRDRVMAGEFDENLSVH